ncbi:MAG: hypothetical protein WAW17_17530, partial [Rhodococcus sp. (in: high G+C Gram-positive bacteria)]
MGTVRSLPTSVSGVRLADAVPVFLGTIPAANTRRGYGVVLNRLVADFGADTNVTLLDQEPDRVSGWFTFVWGNKAATTFNVRLAALRSACEYWREQNLMPIRCSRPNTMSEYEPVSVMMASGTFPPRWSCTTSMTFNES